MDDTAQDQPDSVTLPQKEQEPTRPSYLERVERQPEIPPEVAQLGMTPVSQTTVFRKEEEEAGIRPAGAEIEPSLEPEGIVQSSLTQKEARQALRIHKDIAEAIVWLANFVLRQFKIKFRKSEGHV